MIDINEMKLGDIKKIASMLAGYSEPTLESPMTGKYVIIRSINAGVHAGYLVSQVNGSVILKDSRRLFTWGSDGGVALSGVAQLGMVAGKKIDTLNPLIQIEGAIETILCSEIARESINDY